MRIRRAQRPPADRLYRTQTGTPPRVRRHLASKNDKIPNAIGPSATRMSSHGPIGDWANERSTPADPPQARAGSARIRACVFASQVRPTSVHPRVRVPGPQETGGLRDFFF